MKKSEMKIKDLYSLDHTMAKSLLEQFEYPWEALAHIGEYVEKLGESLPKNEYMNPAKGIWIHKSSQGCPDSRNYRTGNHRTGGGSSPLRFHPRKGNHRSQCSSRQFF